MVDFCDRESNAHPFLEVARLCMALADLPRGVEKDRRRGDAVRGQHCRLDVGRLDANAAHL